MASTVPGLGGRPSALATTAAVPDDSADCGVVSKQGRVYRGQAMLFLGAWISMLGWVGSAGTLRSLAALVNMRFGPGSLLLVVLR